MTSSSSSRISAVRPLWAVEGGRVTIEGSGFARRAALPRGRRSAARRRGLTSRRRPSLTAIVPAGPRRRPHADPRRRASPGETAYVEIGAPLATGLHQVDSPAFDAAGNLYVTFSGSRGQQAPVAIFVVRPDGSREPFVVGSRQPDVAGVQPATAGCTCRAGSTAACTGSTRRDRVRPSRPISASRAALRSARRHAVRRRSIRIDPARPRRTRDDLREHSAERRGVPPGVRAGRLAVRDGAHARRARLRLSHLARRSRARSSTTASAGRRGWRSTRTAISTSSTRSPDSSGLYRLRLDRPDEAELVLSGGSLIGLAFDPTGGFVLASSDTVYRFDGTPAAVGRLIPRRARGYASESLADPIASRLRHESRANGVRPSWGQTRGRLHFCTHEPTVPAQTHLRAAARGRPSR